ncbi:MAG TPA: hypothetical protein VF158_06625 [Longimicrobiales bacterium]
MPKEIEYSCGDGACTWRWNPNDYPVDELTVRVRHRSGDMEVRTVPNTGWLVLPDDLEVDEIVSTGQGGRTREERWRGPG